MIIQLGNWRGEQKVYKLEEKTDKCTLLS